MASINLKEMKRICGIYEVEDFFKPDGSWSGYRCSVINSKDDTKK
jgi:hypothetical protein